MKTNTLLIDSWMSYYHGIVNRLLQFYTRAEAATWLETPHPQLDGKTARDVVDAGDEERVLEIIDRLEST